MTEAEEYLLTYLKDWLEWAEKDGRHEEDKVSYYYRNLGLCASLIKFCKRNNLKFLRENPVRETLKAKLKRDYPKEQLYPFGGEEAYAKEYEEETAHLNSARLAWVRKTINELEKTQSVKEILILARAKIENPENWTTYAFGRNNWGKSVGSLSQDAVCFCSLGAIRNVANGDETLVKEAVKELYTQIDQRNPTQEAGHKAEVMDFNDTHTHEQVLALFDKAIRNCTK